MVIKTLISIIIIIVCALFLPKIWANRNTTDETLKKKNRRTINIVLVAIIGLYALYYSQEIRQIRQASQPTLAQLVEAAKKVRPLPYDYGNGVVWVNLYASDNKVISVHTANIRSEEIEGMDATKLEMESAMKEEANPTLCSSKSSTFFYENNIKFVYVYTFLDNKTIEIELSARNCPFVK